MLSAHSFTGRYAWQRFLMLCPTDNHKMKCIDSRPYNDGTVRRRYKCDTCGKKFVGVEEIVHELKGGMHGHYETRQQFKERAVKAIGEL